MPKVPLYNQAGEQLGEIELSQSLFGAKLKPALVHQVVVGLQANARTVIAHTKTRDEVRGGGKKPWKQKHTGRARHGSIRSPLWIGGGVVFGPRNDRSYAKKIPKSMKRAALASVLSDKVNEHALIVLDTLSIPEPKTKLMAQTLAALMQRVPHVGKKKLILVKKNPNIVRAIHNLPSVSATGPEHVGILDIIGNPIMIATREAITALEKLHAKA